MDVTVAQYIGQNRFYFSPLKVVESLAAGRPVVAPRLGQLTEMVPDGVTGLLVPAGDREAFAGRVLALLNDPARLQAMGRAAPAAARAGPAWYRTARPR